MALPFNYLIVLARIESSQELAAPKNLYVYNDVTGASGLFQFLKSTWKAYGGQWGNGAGAFGGLRPSLAEQEFRARKLATDDAKRLIKNDILVTNSTLYTMHFLGATKGLRVLKANDNSSMLALVGAEALRNNDLPLTISVGEFKTWVQEKTGDKKAIASNSNAPIDEGFQDLGLTIQGQSQNWSDKITSLFDTSAMINILTISIGAITILIVIYFLINRGSK